MWNPLVASSPDPWRGVFFEGPWPPRNPPGFRLHRWKVFVGDHDGQAIDKVFSVRGYDRADQLARDMAHDRHLPLIHRATRGQKEQRQH